MSKKKSPQDPFMPTWWNLAYLFLFATSIGSAANVFMVIKGYINFYDFVGQALLLTLFFLVSLWVLDQGRD